MGFLNKFFAKWKENDDFLEEEDLWDKDYFYKKERAGIEDEEEPRISSKEGEMGSEDSQWDWDSLTNERTYLKLTDPYQREKYIRSLVEQVKDASTELDKLSYEYNVVTAVLKDMDEIEALPPNEKQRMSEYAKKILHYEKEQKEYKNKKSRMTESQYYRMEQYEDTAPKVYDDMHKAEKYREMIRDDLSRLEGEKHAYEYRKGELRANIANSRGMVMVVLLAMGLLFLMLLIMQFGFEMRVMAGYMLTIIAGGGALAIVYSGFLEQTKEFQRIEKGMNRIILLQNTVKIRYVNNVNLLDYLYLKYNVKSAREWKTLFELYEEEKKAREINEQNAEEMDYYQTELLKILRNYQLSDARLWVRCPFALYDHREMVEIRHEHIVRRQKLRAQMDYNKRMAKEGERELKEFVTQYPQYSKEALNMMDRYS